MRVCVYYEEYVCGCVCLCIMRSVCECVRESVCVCVRERLCA